MLGLLSGGVGASDGDPVGQARSDRLGAPLAVAAETVDLGPGGRDHLVRLRFVTSQDRDDGCDVALTRLLLTLALALVRRAGRAGGPESFEQFAESGHDAAEPPSIPMLAPWHPGRQCRRSPRDDGGMTQGRVVLDRVSKTYHRGPAEVRALSEVSLRIEPGEFVVLLGPSGSGKTTLLNLLGTIEPPSSGTVTVSGIDLGGLRGADLTEYRRRQVGFVFQFFNLVPTLTAAENVEVIAELVGGDARARAVGALRRVGLAHRLDHFPAQLSGGEQQRVAIARALVKEPPVVLTDEPTGSLDLDSGKQVLQLLRDAAADGHTVLLVTHNSAIAAIADRVVELGDGEVRTDRPVASPAPVEAVAW